ncbi:hypothetical protein [Thermopirellula anaerolimosa]
MKNIFGFSVCTFAAVGLAVLTLPGCGKGKTSVPKTYPTSIKITYRGQPLEGASVTLIPQDQSGRGASGVTNAEGVAKLAIPGLAEGAVPGKYWITVSKVEGGGAATATTAEEFYKQQEAGANAAPSGPKQVLPVKYLSAQSSGLECTVAEQEGEQVFEFNLTD